MLAIGVDSMHDMFVEMHLENEAILLTKQVEFVDIVTSQGASHVMLHAMRCMDVVCDDALPGGHEYQEQVESKTAAMMRRICANLDKQKMCQSGQAENELIEQVQEIAGLS